MADSKISALPASTTPLAGSELVPVVQSGTTKQVSVANLTAGRAVSASSLTTSGAGGVSTELVSFNNYIAIPNTFGLSANASDGTIVSSYSGYNISFAINGNVVAHYNNSDGNHVLRIGNLVFGTAAKGVNFTANTPAAGMTSQLLNWYEEGTFTPTYTSDGTPPTCTYAIQDAKYTRIGRMVYFSIEIRTDTASGGTGNLGIAGLPFTSKNDRYSGTVNVGFAYSFTTQCPTTGYIPANSTTLYLCFKTSATEISNINSSVLTNAAASNYLLISGSYVV